MVDKKTVRKVADSAHISLTPSELKRLEKDLKEILKDFEILDSAPISRVKPSFQPIEIKNTTRKDVIKPSLPRKKALANARHREKGFFKGPGVV